MEYLIIILSGFLGGILAGLYGIGGGVIFTILIYHYFNYYSIEPESISLLIIANSLACIFFSTLGATIKNIQLNTFYLKQVLLTSIPATIVLMVTFFGVVNSNWFSITVFDIVILSLMMFMLIKSLFDTFVRSNDQDHISPLKNIATGIAGGVTAALSGFGGGVVMVPLMNAVFKLKYKKSKNISIGVIFIMVTVLTSLNLIQPSIQENFIGNIHYKLVIMISIGSMIGAYAATHFSHKLSNRYNKKLYIGFLVLFISWKIGDLWGLF